MAWLTSAIDPNVRPGYRAVHRDRGCGQFKRIARHAVVEVPGEFVCHFYPCSFCVPPSWAWQPAQGRVPRALVDWYRAARAAAIPPARGDRGDFDVWRGEIVDAKAGKPQDWGDEGPGPDELEVLLDVLEEAGRREEAERRLRHARGW